MIFMIKITDVGGLEHNVNLAHVTHVDLPSGSNLNERLYLITGFSYILLAGTWEAALDALFVEFNANPQPMPNVKDKVFVDLS